MTKHSEQLFLRSMELPGAHEMLQELNGDPITCIGDPTGDAYVHSIETSMFAATACDKLALCDRLGSIVTTAALFHDLGKSDLPETLFTTNEQYNPVERFWMKMHPFLGVKRAKLLRELDLASSSPTHDVQGWNTIDVLIAWHHPGYISENLTEWAIDEGLLPPEIPEEVAQFNLSRVVQIADQLNALLSNRPYKSKRLAAEGFTNPTDLEPIQERLAAAGLIIACKTDFAGPDNKIFRVLSESVLELWSS